MSEKAWRTYEEVAAELLDRNAEKFGLQRVEGKQHVRGNRSGTKWEIDAKGVKLGDEGFVIVECKRHTISKPNQELLGGLAYRIVDTGASGGIIVSPLDLQEGAAKVAAAEDIINVQLDAESTPDQFAMKFLNHLMIGVPTATMKIVGMRPTVKITRACEACSQPFEPSDNEALCPDCRSQPTP